MQVVKITGEVRTDIGKTSNKALRKEGKIPSIIYGGGENINFSTTTAEVKTLVFTPDFKLAEIEIDGNVHKAILKDIQFHPVTDEILHIDFLKLVDDVPVKLELPIKFVGASPGVKNGGKLIRNVRKVKIKTTPQYIIDHVEADISKLKLAESIRIKDITDEEGVEITSNGNIPIATVLTPRALKAMGDALEATLEEEELPISEEGTELGEGEGAEESTEASTEG